MRPLVCVPARRAQSAVFEMKEESQQTAVQFLPAFADRFIKAIGEEPLAENHGVGGSIPSLATNLRSGIQPSHLKTFASQSSETAPPVWPRAHTRSLRLRRRIARARSSVARCGRPRWRQADRHDQRRTSDGSL